MVYMMADIRKKEQNMTAEQIQFTPQRPGFLTRLLRAFVKTTLTLIILVVLAVAGWFGFKELRRSFDILNGQIDRQAAQLIQLQGQLNDQAGQLEVLQQANGRLEAQLADGQEALQSDLDRQDEMLREQSSQIEGLVAADQTFTQTISLLNAGQIAMQQDVVSLGSELDAFGGDFDQLLGEMTTVRANETALSEEVAAFAAELTAADPAALRQTVFVFRVWELVTRARLRLAEQNFGLAAADIDLAQIALSDLLAASAEPLVEPLQQVEQRVLLAAENLATAPETTVSDLDIAWQELDAILAALLGVEDQLNPVPAP